ncbi:Uncharacterised protein [uncultured archaeon]|nr:Uncharacterised protein [uncultured archaeon]
MQAAARLESLYAAVLGTPAATPSTIVSFLIFLPSLLLGISAVLAYFALRSAGFSKSFSSFAPMLFVLAASMIAFMPGTYSASQLSCVFFFAFLASFAAFSAKGGKGLLALSAFFAAIAGYIDAPFAVAGIFIAAAFCLTHCLYDPKRKSELPYYAAIGVLFLAVALLSSGKPLALDAANATGAFYSMPFLVAAASGCVVLLAFGHAAAGCLLLVIGAALLSFFSPLAAAALLVLPAAEGMSKASVDIPKSARLACAYVVALLAIFGLALQGAEPVQSFVAALLLAAIAPLLMHFYEYQNRALFVGFAIALLALSAFTTIAFQMQRLASGPAYPQYIDKDLSDGLSFFSTRGIGTVSSLGNADAVRFYLPSSSIGPGADLKTYLLSGKPLPQSGSYLIVSLLDIDNLSEGNGFASYRYAGNYTNGGTQYALFASYDGLLLSRELTPAGALSLKDGAALDSYGRYYGYVPLSRMMLLSANKSYFDEANRLIVLEEGTLPPHFITIYSEAAGELSEVTAFGKVSFYKVR